MTDNADQGTHFWFMAIQTPNSRGYFVADYKGTITPEPGATRLDLFNELLDGVGQRWPESRGGVVLAFDIQPNKL